MKVISFKDTFGTRLDLAGDEDAPLVDGKLKELPPGEDVAFCLHGVEYLGYSYSKPTIRKALMRCGEGAYGDRRIFIVSDLDEQFLEGLEAALREEKVVAYAAPSSEELGREGRLIGAVTDALTETFEVLLRRAPLSTGTLAKALSTSVQNAKNRMDRLIGKNVATREKVASESGGREWENRIM